MLDKEDSLDNSCSGGRWLDTQDLKTLQLKWLSVLCTVGCLNGLVVISEVTVNNQTP